MFIFIGFLFSLLKGIYNTCAIHTQVNRQASVARILFAGFFGFFSTLRKKIFLDAQKNRIQYQTINNTEHIWRFTEQHEYSTITILRHHNYNPKP